MHNNPEKETILADMCESIDGSTKNKETGEYIKVLRGRKNKNYGNPEMAICVEAFEELKATKPYGWQDKNGKTWIPVRLKVWNNVKKEDAASAPVDDGEPLPF